MKRFMSWYALDAVAIALCSGALIVSINQLIG